jgi:hypothetical protein
MLFPSRSGHRAVDFSIRPSLRDRPANIDKSGSDDDIDAFTQMINWVRAHSPKYGLNELTICSFSSNPIASERGTTQSIGRVVHSARS